MQTDQQMFTNDSETDPAEWSLKMETMKLQAANSSSVHKDFMILLLQNIYEAQRIKPGRL